MTSALKLAQSVELAEMVVAIELMSAARGLDLRGDVSTVVLEEARDGFRETVPEWVEDCVLSVPMERAAEFVRAGGFGGGESGCGGPTHRERQGRDEWGTECEWEFHISEARCGMPGFADGIEHGGGAMSYVPVRAARGNVRTAKGWIQEAAKRMLMNNLDPEVAEKPEELIVYGGRGKAARNWECFHKIVETLDRLENTQTLLVQSGKPVGVVDTHSGLRRGC